MKFTIEKGDFALKKGAFGGHGGNWLPYGYTYTSEVEDVYQ